MAKLLIALAVICAAFAQVSAMWTFNLRFYTGSTIEEYVEYPILSGEQAVDHGAWNFSKPTMIYAHGLNESYDSESALTIAGAFLEHGGYNVITLDTVPDRDQPVAEVLANYLTAAGGNGQLVGEMINRFIAKGVPASSFLLVGYSTGADVVGNAARVVDGIERIIALDPLRHASFIFGKKDSLRSTDAKSVEVYYSNMVLMSSPDPQGTANFYPNKGYAMQPGCTNSDDIELLFCNSDVSWRWFAESVNNPTAFKSINCDSWSEFENGTCTGSTDYMGLGFSRNATGNFYLQTNISSPYSKGDDGIKFDGSELTVLSPLRINLFLYKYVLAGVASIFGQIWG